MHSLRIFHSVNSRRLAGSEQVLAMLAQGQRDAGHQILIHCKGGGELARIFREKGFEVVTRDLGLPFANRWCKNQIKAWKPDIVHTHLTQSTRSFQRATEGTSSSFLVSHAHVFNNDSSYPGVAKNGALIAVSSEIKKFYEKECEFEAPNIPLIYNGSNFNRSEARAMSRSDARSAVNQLLGLPENALPILLAGRICKQKGQDVLIRALHHIAKRQPNAHFVSVGTAKGNKVFQKSIVRLSEELGVEDRVHFLGFRTDIPLLMRGSAISIVPSRFDPFPLVALESMAVGVPLIVTAASGLDEMVEEGDNGLKFQLEDYVALGEQIDRVLKDESLANELIEGGYRAIDGRYSMSLFLSKVEQVYRAGLAN